MSVDISPRTCRSCGRTMTWRKAWTRDWEQVRYCSQACRRRRVRPVDRYLEFAILELLVARTASATICPSEAAQQVAVRYGASDEWCPLMEPARRAARRLAAEGQVTIIQGGRPVDPSAAKGPIRIRRSH